MAYSPIFRTPTGLLGLSQDQRRTRAIGDTLTALGIGLMGQGPSTTPQNPLQGLAMGLQGANQLADQRTQQDSQAQRDAIQAQTFGMEQQKFNTEQEMAKARADAMEKAIVGLTPEQQAAARADPDSFWKAYSDHLFSTQAAHKVGDTRTIQMGGDAVTQEYQQDGSWKELGRGPKFAPPDQTTVNLPPTEGAFAKAFGGAEGDAAAKLSNEVGAQAQAQIDNLNALKGAVGALQAAGGDTGALSNIEMKATQIAQAVGIDPTQLGLPENAGPAELINAISNKLALQERNPAGGAGMPGAMSDADRNYLSQTVPNLGDTPQGMSMKLEIAQKIAQRNIDKAYLWNSDKYEHTAEGFAKFKRDWAQYVKAHPLFSMSDRQRFNSNVTVGKPVQPQVVDQLPAGNWQ